MKVELHILNDNPSSSGDGDKIEATWHIRRKSYESDDNFIDDDIINCPISHKLDRMIIEDVQITSVDQIEKVIKLLENAKPCFK